MAKNKFFRVVAKEGDKPVVIVADTLVDAQCQAREMNDGNKPFHFKECTTNVHINMDKTFSAMFL